MMQTIQSLIDETIGVLEKGIDPGTVEAAIRTFLDVLEDREGALVFPTPNGVRVTRTVQVGCAGSHETAGHRKA